MGHLPTLTTTQAPLAKLLRWCSLAMTLGIAQFAQATPFSQVSTTLSIPDGYTEMLLPSDQGLLVPISAAQTTAYEIDYPSAHQNMQFMAFRNPTTNDIYYVQTQDPDGQLMHWKVEYIDPHYQLILTGWSQNGIFPVSVVTDSSLEATTQTEFYRVVARKYKTWAINQKWARRKFSPLDRMTALGVSKNANVNEVNKLLNDRYLGQMAPSQSSACYLTFWRMYWQYGIDGALPDYRLNTYNSSTSLSTMNNANCASFGYTNALLWDDRLKHTASPAPDTMEAHMNEVLSYDATAAYDPDLMVKNEDGSVLTTKKGDVPSYGKYICQAQTAWKDRFLDVVTTMSGAGWKGIYYDMAAMEAPRPCYSEDHGHEKADPLAWQEGIRSILSAVKSETTPPMMVFTEGSAEIYMDLVDAYLNYWGTARVDSAGAKQVPLFREVYGEIARWVGWQVIPISLDTAGQQTIHAPSLTPDDMIKAVRKADNFGAMFHGAPFMVGTSADDTVLEELANSEYDDLTALLAKPPYKTVYERGAGASNWSGAGSAPTPVNVVDSETGTAAVSVGVVNRDSGDSNMLSINDNRKFLLSWDMKMSNSYYITAIVTTVEDGPGPWYYLLYDPHARSWKNNTDHPSFGKFGLGADTYDNHWRTFQRDLAADLYWATGKTIANVVGFKVNGTGLVDNIALSDAPAAIVEDGTDASDWIPTCYIAGCNLSGVSAASATDTDTGADVIRFGGITNRDNGQGFVRALNDSAHFEASWDLKTTSPYYVSFFVEADDGQVYNLLYDQNARDYRVTVSTTVKLGLGADTYDGQWRTFRRNLADDLFEGTGKSIVKVVSARVITAGSDGAISNVKLWGNGLRSSGY